MRALKMYDSYPFYQLELYDQIMFDSRIVHGDHTCVPDLRFRKQSAIASSQYRRRNRSLAPRRRPPTKNKIAYESKHSRGFFNLYVLGNLLEIELPSLRVFDFGGTIERPRGQLSLPVQRKEN